MPTVQNSIVLTLPPANYWNYRFVRFPQTEVMDEDAYTIELCEVHYHNDEPHSYALACPPYIDNLDAEDSSDSAALIKHCAWYAEKILAASQKPILDLAIFEK